MTPVSSTAVRAWSDQAMDGTALNLEQQRRAYNPSPECDSLVEHITAMVREGHCPAHLGEMLRLTRELVELNQQERGIHQQLAGEFDELARLLRNAELNSSTAPRAISAMQIVGQVREPLRILRNRDEHDEYTVALAGQAVMDLVVRVPQRQLLAAKVRNNLGEGPFGQLAVMAQAHTDAARQPQQVAA